MDKPEGELVLKTVALPADTNANGDIFGGWLLSQMDIAGGIAAKKRSKSRVATVALDAMVFHKPVCVGDLVCCYANINRVGKTSMNIHIEVWILRHPFDETEIKVTEGVFTFVAIDSHGRSQSVDRKKC